MKLHFLLPVVIVSVCAPRLEAAVATLTSPNGTWQLISDEFGASGGGLPGGGQAFHNFGTGMTDYSWATSVMITDGVTRQPLSSNTGGGWSPGTALGAGNVLSDVPGASSRASSYSVTGFPTLRVNLTQTVTDSGIYQQYVLSNTGATPLNLTFLDFHDVDLDGNTFLNDTLTSTGGGVRISEGARSLFFNPSPVGFQGFMAGFVPPGGGVTGALDVHAWNNFGIPIADLNTFREFTYPPGGLPAVYGNNMDANGDGISDTPEDVGYLFQNRLSIPANGSVSLTLETATVPEPSAALLGLLTLGLGARRRR